MTDTPPLKIATWNVNSIKARLPNALDWLAEAQPDIVVLQEIKCIAEAFPTLEIEAAGYNIAVVGQKTYNGVALLSKHPIAVELTALPGDETDAQARYIEAETAGVRIAGLYLPNGNPYGTEKYAYKLAWMDRLIAHAQGLFALDEPVVVTGDFNVIPADADCWDPSEWTGDALYAPETLAKWRTLMHQGWIDAFRAVDASPHCYTFWDYQKGRYQKDQGIRIDHLLLNPAAADRLVDCRIDSGPRGREKASDHTPIWVTLTG